MTTGRTTGPTSGSTTGPTTSGGGRNPDGAAPRPAGSPASEGGFDGILQAGLLAGLSPAVLAEDRTLEVECTATDPSQEGFTDEMQQALAQLPDDLRETLLLVVVAELTHQEAADVLGIPLGTVLSRVSRARKRLRDHWIALNGVKQ